MRLTPKSRTWLATGQGTGAAAVAAADAKLGHSAMAKGTTKNARVTTVGIMFPFSLSLRVASGSACLLVVAGTP